MTLIWFLIVLGVLIFVHELGHFVVGKLFNVYIDRFSLGFGPKLVSFTHGETEYCISAFPLGGYVRMAGQFDLPEEYTDEQTRAEFAHVPEQRRYDHQAVWKRMLIIVAGPVMNILFALPVAFVMLMIGETQTLLFDATTVGIVAPGSPAMDAGILPGDEIVSIGGAPVQSWRELTSETHANIGRTAAIVVRRGDSEIEMAVTPVVNERKGIVGIGVAPIERAQIAMMQPDSPAAAAGLRVGDVVERVIDAHTTAVDRVAVIDAVRARPDQPVALRIRRFPLVRSSAQTNAYTITNITVETASCSTLDALDIDDAGRAFPLLAADTNGPVRAGDLVVAINGMRLAPTNVDAFVRVMPVGVATVTLQRVTGRVAKKQFTTNAVVHVTRIGYIGVWFMPASQVVKYTPLDALVASPGRCYDVFLETVHAVRLLVERRLAVSSLAGPISIMRMTGVAARSGMDALLGLMLLISVNLGVLNLLPLPVLDGGHIVLLAAEGIYRKPLPAKVIIWVQKTGFWLIMLLMAYVLFNDVRRVVVQYAEQIGLMLGRVM